MRKNHLLSILEHEVALQKAKADFIALVIKGDLDLSRSRVEDIHSELRRRAWAPTLLART